MGGGPTIARSADVLACLALLLVSPGCSLDLEGTGIGTSVDPSTPTDAPIDPRVPVESAPDAAVAVDAAGVPPGMPVAPPLDAAVACSFDGAFAMKLEFDVSWQATSVGVGLASLPLVAPGSGTLIVYTAALVHAEGDGYVASIRPCGTEVPDFQNGSTRMPERYGVYVPDLAWDSPAMPTWDVAWRAECPDPGCAMHGEPFDAWLGAKPAPVDAPRARVEALDVDTDGNPGITVLTRGPGELAEDGAPYAQPPIDVSLAGRLLAPTRAHDLMLGIGIRARFDGRIRSCDRIEGASDDGSVRGVAFGCTAEDARSACAGSVVRAVDAKLPAWRVHAARYRTERLAWDQAEDQCGSVRAFFRGR